MPTTPEAAYEAITDHFSAYWAANAVDVINPAPELRFEGIETGEIPKEFFARFALRPALEGQSSLRDGDNGQRYTAEGIIFVQVFGPRGAANPRAQEYTRRLANVAKNAFRGQSLFGCIWFRNCRVNALDPESKYHRFNAIAEYRYDEIGKGKV